MQRSQLFETLYFQVRSLFIRKGISNTKIWETFVEYPGAVPAISWGPEFLYVCVAVCCSVLQCVAVCCSVLQIDIALANFEALSMNALCDTHECVTSHVWMCHVTRMNASRHTYECVTSHVWMCHVTRMNASRHTYECVTSHVWMRHVSHMSHTHESYIDNVR